MIDLHSHILPGLDDGARSVPESLAIARAAVADGITTIAGTPHVRDDWPTTPRMMEESLATLRRALAAESLPLDVVSGAEVALDHVERLGADELRRLSLAGNGRYLLVEFPYVGWPLALGALVLSLAARGITAVIAHPERNASVQSDPERLRPIILSGALAQLTASSLDGRMGRRARTAAFELIDRGLAHLVASDAHGPDVRQIGMSRAAEAVGERALARWLTTAVPAAIVAGDTPPPRPGGRTRRRTFFTRVRG